MTSHSTDQSDLTQIPGAAPFGPTNIPWLTFSGSPHESVGTFIQSVHRVALQLNNMYEDGWIAHYAAASFIDDSLFWYSDLDEETCNSWRKLRRALLQEYGNRIRSVVLPSREPSPVPQDLGSPQRSEGEPTIPTAPSTPNIPRERKGKIEVFLYNYPKTVGFLAYDALSSKFSIVPNQDLAQVVSFTRNPWGSPFSIRMEGLPAEAPYPYVGVALWNNNSNALNTVPPVLLTGIDRTEYTVDSSLFSRSRGQGMIGMPMGMLGMPMGTKVTTTWIIRTCAESSPIPRYRRIAKTNDPRVRASSAVWKHDEHTNQLSMTWMMDDDSQEELTAIVLDGEQGASLQIHRIYEWQYQDESPNGSRVKLVFVPEGSD